MTSPLPAIDGAELGEEIAVARRGLWLIEGRQTAAERGLWPTLGRRAVAPAFYGGWEPGRRRPFGGLAELCTTAVAWIRPRDPALLSRFNVALANLLPAARRWPELRHARLLRSRLADFALEGDAGGLGEFYWRRDVGPWLLADLVRFLAGVSAHAAAEGAPPPLLLLDGVERGGAAAVRALGWLAERSRQTPLRLVAVCRRPLAPPRAAELAAAGFAPLRLESDIEGADGGHGAKPGELSDAACRLLEAASIAALPLSVERWRSLAPDSGEGLHRAGIDELCAAGLVLDTGGGFRALPSAHRRRLERALDPADRRRLHLLAGELEGSDPFAAAWHATEGGEGGVAVTTVAERALERAWAVSDYRNALHFAHRLIRTGSAGRTGRDVLLALLHYEAGRFGLTDRHLERALAADDGVDEVTVRRLLGYNAIFGLHDFARGERLLDSLSALYEARGQDEEAAGVRNSIAFALARDGRLDQAVELETTTLEAMERAGSARGFLGSIVQLNLGRLYRNLGLPRRALELIDRARDDARLEMSPYLLLIFHASRAQVLAAEGDPAAALAAVEHCFELARDLKLDHVGEPVIGLLARPLGRRPDPARPPDEQLLDLLYRNLAHGHRALVHTAEADAYERGYAGAGTGAPAAGSPARDREAAGAPDSLDSVCRRFAAWLEPALHGAGALPAAVETLGAGGSVAVVQPTGHGGRFECTVLFDPRCPELGRRLRTDLGAETLPGALAAVVTPEAAALFSPPLDADAPLLYQEATLDREARAPLAALLPVALRVQVLPPEAGGATRLLLAGFAAGGGPGVLAAIPFHLRQRDLALTPMQAVAAFLASPVDKLLIGDRLLTKRHGASAAENLLPFRPRLSRQATILRSAGGEADDEVVVRVQVWAYRSHLRLNAAMRPLLADCDGERTLAEVLQRAGPGLAGDAAAARRLCDYLRDLWRRGVLTFDRPPALPRAGESELVTADEPAARLQTLPARSETAGGAPGTVGLGPS